MATLPKPKPGKKQPKQTPVDGVEVGDWVYARHPVHGPMTVRVRSRGAHGFRGRDEAGQMHGLYWDTYLGHQRRALGRFSVVNQGADGALVEDENGRRRFVGGELELPEPPKPGNDFGQTSDDPLEGGMDKLGKALNRGRALFFKAAVANRPGLALKDVTDKVGHHTKRWTRTNPDQPGAGGGKVLRHGDTAHFRHGNVMGSGKIAASGADGVTLHDDAGNKHQVRHEHLTDADGKPLAGEGGGEHAPAAAAGGAGEGNGGAGDAAGEGHNLIPPDKFNASSVYQDHADPNATAETVLAQFPPEVAAKVEEFRKKVGGLTQTQDKFKVDGQYTPERVKVHQRIYDHFLSDERIAAARPKDGEAPKFILLGGRGGSGKSQLEGLVFDPESVIKLDADEIKGMLPEYKGWNAAEVHEESGDIFDAITEYAAKLGLNIVHDATMKTAKKAVALVQHMKGQGYGTEAHYMFLPPQEAAKRAIGRFQTKKGDFSGRFVPPEVVLGNTGNEASFDQVKGLVDGWSFRDNNVPQGQPPRLLSEKKGNGDSAGSDGRNGLPGAAGKPGDAKPAAGKAPGGRGGGYPPGHRGHYAPSAAFTKATRPGGVIVFAARPR